MITSNQVNYQRQLIPPTRLDWKVVGFLCTPTPPWSSGTTCIVSGILLVVRNRWVPIKFHGTLGPSAQNPRWRPGIIGGPANLAPMALRANILVAIISFSGTAETLNLFSQMCPRGILAEFVDFLAFSVVFEHFLQYFHSYGTYSQNVGTYQKVLEYWQYAETIFTNILAVF